MEAHQINEPNSATAYWEKVNFPSGAILRCVISGIELIASEYGYEVDVPGKKLYQSKGIVAMGDPIMELLYNSDIADNLTNLQRAAVYAEVKLDMRNIEVIV